MPTKYGIARDVVNYATDQATENNMAAEDLHEALLISLIQALKDSKGVPYLVPLLRYEIDSLDSGGNFDIARGGGHS